MTEKLLRPDMPMPDLSTSEGQAAIDAIIPTDTALIIVDKARPASTGSHV